MFVDDSSCTLGPRTLDSLAEPAAALRVAVVYATRSRPEILASVVETLDAQTRAPDRVIISAASILDLGPLRSGGRVCCLIGPAGLTRQRNAALKHLNNSADIVVFFDDDFLPHPQWLERVEAFFQQNPTVMAITGHVIADGINGPGLSFLQASRMINAKAGACPDYIREGFSPYGCNMAFRCAGISGLSFDESLVLYGWLEDRDFGGALRKRGGRLVKLGSAVGVHLGVKTGRVSGHRLGYSQIVNPFYLYRKGTMTKRSLILHLFRNLVSNTLRSAVPERHIDRLGRLRGNIRGVRDLLSGVLIPERAEFL